MSTSGPQKTAVEALAEEYLARLRAGEEPSVAEYCSAYPALANEIGKFFPTLRLVENFKPGLRDALPHETIEALPHLERLGDFRIVREIGRGGMGVVYLAEQESLKRTVALKVLPSRSLPDARRRKRFLREARSAARLHHTNIVPIFGVGEHQGLPYYVMQYIPGLGLDRVLAEVRRKRQNLDAPQRRETDVDLQPAAFRLADSLLTGTFALTGVASDGDHLRILPQAWATDIAGPGGSSAKPTPADGRAAHEVVLSSTERAGYWRSVAHIGNQAAEALHYAHLQGIIHRDVKPANLLLDPQGTVWVTDFGLAKAEDEEDLTHSGDFVGTLRYMAPELFHGVADARSDVYSLGLTLYELLAARPAYSDSQRNALVRRVMTEAPARLRAVDPRVPGDLDIIVHKSIERDPDRRYQTAQDLADDLRRFLGNEPIKARRASYVNRSARWCRRNPSLASLLAILVLVAIISPLAALRFSRLAAERSAAAASALSAEQDAVHQLYLAKRAEARASRFSGRSGQRFASLRALFAARQLPVDLAQSVEAIADIRDEVIACLAVPDLHARRQWLAPPSLTRLETIHFDPELGHYVSLDDDALTVRRTFDNIELARLPVDGGVPETARFSPDGQLIALCYHESDHDWLRIWDWKTGEIILRIPDRIGEFACDFSPDSRYFAAGGIDSTVTIYDLMDVNNTHRFVAASPPFALRFHPNGQVIAVSCEAACCVQMWDLETREVLRTLKHPTDVYGIAWHPTGDYFAAAEGHRIHVWDLEAASDAPLNVLDETTWVVHDLQFHPNGRILYSHSWREGKTRVWDPFRGEHLLIADGHFSTISRDGQAMGFRTSKEIGIWDVAGRDACCRPFAYDRIELGINACDYSDDGRWLAAAAQSGVQIWDTAAWESVVHIPMTPASSIRFEASSRSLLVSTTKGLFRWPIEWSRTLPVRIGPPERIELPAELIPGHIDLSQDRRTSIVELLYPPPRERSDQAILIDPSGQRLLSRQPKLRFVSLSPDGRLAAVGNWEGSGATIWNAATAQRVQRLPTVGNTVTRFTPDGHRLVTVTPREICFWDVQTWQPAHKIAKPGIGFWDAIVFTRDGRYMAMTATHSMIQLVHVASGKVVASLQADDSPALVKSLAFSPTGSQLAVCCYGDGLRVWDLRYIREQLRRENLDWDAGPLPEAPTRHLGPIKVEVDWGDLNPGQGSS